MAAPFASEECILFGETALDVILEWNEESSSCANELADSSRRSRMTSSAVALPEILWVFVDCRIWLEVSD